MSTRRSTSIAWIDPFLGPVAPGLGWVPSIRYLLRRDRVLAMLRQLGSPGTVVEVGCGAGALLHEIAQRSGTATGLETSTPAIRVARGIAEACGGAQEIVQNPSPEWVGRLDLVCAFDVLEHIEDDDGALREWRAWLRRSGLICLTVPAHQHRWGAGDEWAGHWRRYDRTALLNLLRRNGLEVQHFECYGFPLANFTEFAGNLAYRRRLRESGTAPSRADASADSGVAREEYMRFFRIMNSAIGRSALRVATFAQAHTCRRDWGSGYLVLARRA